MEGVRIQYILVTPSANRKQVRCIQINLQHSRSATNNLTKKIDDEEPDIILIRELYEYQDRITGIDKNYRMFTAGKGSHYNCK